MVLFMVEVLVVGALAVYLLTVIPAGVATAAKGNGRLLTWGFLTFGLSWYGGAAALAPPGSRWARRRYDEAQRQRAVRPLSRQRTRRVFFTWAAVATLITVLTGLFITLPAPVLGVNAKALGNSVPGFGGCDHLEGDEYRCGVEPLGTASSGSAFLPVRVDELGCWHLVAAPRSPDRDTEGCISAYDYLNPFGFE
jgi:hypothetical protein